MKKNITLRLCFVIIISMLLIAFLSLYFQIESSKETMHTNSHIRINQIAQILDKNEKDIAILKENLKEDYFIRAKAAAYIVQNQPEVIEDLKEMKKIAALLQIDEFHLFDPEGTLYAGSEPKYYNYTFHSGEQIQFFLPMLNDYSLQLCQDVTPNTTENKPMQYTAVWREDKKGIVQIGMEPTRLMEALQKNELSHIFNMISVENGITIFAIDAASGKLLGSTDNSLVGKQVEDLGFNLSQASSGIVKYILNGKKSYCVIEPTNNVLIGISSTYEELYQNIKANMLLIVISLSLLSVTIIILILKMLDHFILQGIYSLISGMKTISSGDLDFSIDVTNSPEFIVLSQSINEMVKSLLETTGKLSLIFQNVDIPIAVYEYNEDMKRVLATSKIGDILTLSEDELQCIMSDHSLFQGKMEEICSEPFEQNTNVYLLGEDKSQYVRIKSYHEKHKTLGILVDVTEEILEKQKIKSERDIDLLTELASRRALFAQMNHLFLTPQSLKHGAVLMIDTDNLKKVNDTWGHEFGDLLLKKTANLLKTCTAPNHLIGRLSGDEFLLMIYGADSDEEIQRYIDNLYEEMLKTTLIISKDEEVPVRLSGGYIFFSDGVKDYKALIHLADKTMYQVKKSDKGHFQRYSPPLEDTLS